jgi:peptidyl-prolyl cis-trans isomerase A (cyclophilin A)
MRKLTIPILVLVAGTAQARDALGVQRPGIIAIAIETEAGTIEAELDSARAPITVTNFLRYVDARLFDDARFFRSVRLDNQPNDSVRIEVIQADIARENRSRGFPPIPLERTTVTGLRHVDGALSMARAGPDTGRASFSIVINDQPEMDFAGRRNPDGQGFAAFGRVTSGMEIVRRIQQGPVEAQRLTSPIRILRIVRR